jgi:hypothetical protein
LHSECVLFLPYLPSISHFYCYYVYLFTNPMHLSFTLYIHDELFCLFKTKLFHSATKWNWKLWVMVMLHKVQVANSSFIHAWIHLHILLKLIMMLNIVLQLIRNYCVTSTFKLIN